MLPPAVALVLAVEPALAVELVVALVQSAAAAVFAAVPAADNTESDLEAWKMFVQCLPVQIL